MQHALDQRKHDTAVSGAREALGLKADKPERSFGNALIAFHASATQTLMSVAQAFRTWFQPSKNVIKICAIVAGMVTDSPTLAARGIAFAASALVAGAAWGTAILFGHPQQSGQAIANKKQPQSASAATMLATA